MSMMFQNVHAMPAVVTPFNKDLSVDFSSLYKLIDFLLPYADALVVLGTTAETPTLKHSLQEEVKILKSVLDQVNGRVPVVAGCGSNSTDEAIEYTKTAQMLGANAALIVTPYYNRPSQNDLYQHYKMIHSATDLPIIAYNVPGRTGVNMECKTLKRIANLDRVMAIKECNTAQVPWIVKNIKNKRKDNSFYVYTGEDDQIQNVMQMGGDGVISVIMNLLPEAIKILTELCINKNYEEATKISIRLKELCQMAFIKDEGNPKCIKYMLWLAGLIKEYRTRPPLFKPKNKEIIRMKSFIEGQNYASLVQDFHGYQRA
jgi:4-hydroxy-tetrahydrodipicolinate synthase